MKRLCLLLLLLPTLCACQWMKEDFDDEMANATRYINITISVSADHNSATRAPLGGEYGDGDELGIDTRENYVEKITLIFYQDNTGINTSDNNAEVSFVKTYSVQRVDDYPYSHTHIHTTPEPTGYADKEIIYTTGDQKLEETLLVAGETYKVLVVANADVNVKAGDKIKDVRDLTFDKIYEGTGLGIDASKFVMTSEGDATITLTNPWVEEDENKVVFYSDCIHIERLAARIDYCTKGSTYRDDYGGYVYVAKEHPNGKKDLRVVTKVTPFNLYSEPEYMFKQVCNAWTVNQNSITPSNLTFLGDETLVNNMASNYVVDPYTVQKTPIQNGPGPNDVTYNAEVLYENRLIDMIPANPGPGNPANPGDDTNPYAQVMADVHSTYITDHQGYKNIIIAYPRENTLLPQSRFKWYATGIVFEVVSYNQVNCDSNGDPVSPGNGNNPHDTKKYYHYLRHQGEQLPANQHSFKAEELKKDKVDRDNATCDNVPMRCGIVRNNIYRISITGFSEEEGTIMLSIEEEKWRHVDNPPVFI